MKDSAQRAKERLMADIGFPEQQENRVEMEAEPLLRWDDPRNEATHCAFLNTKCSKLGGRIADLAYTQQQLVEAQASADNWKYHYTKLDSCNEERRKYLKRQMDLQKGLVE